MYSDINNIQIKIVLIGNTNVGKSTLLKRFDKNIYDENIAPTIGGSYICKKILIDNKNINIGFWDTAGQERYRSIAKLYYRDAIGCICVLDVTDKKSLTDLDYWIWQYKSFNYIENYYIIIVANKCDIDKKYWQVTEEDLKKISKQNNCQYILTNCVTGHNVTNLFNHIIENILLLDYEDDKHKSIKKISLLEEEEIFFCEESKNVNTKKYCYC